MVNKEANKEVNNERKLLDPISLINELRKLNPSVSFSLKNPNQNEDSLTPFVMLDKEDTIYVSASPRDLILPKGFYILGDSITNKNNPNDCSLTCKIMGITKLREAEKNEAPKNNISEPLQSEEDTGKVIEVSSPEATQNEFEKYYKAAEVAGAISGIASKNDERSKVPGLNGFGLGVNALKTKIPTKFNKQTKEDEMPLTNDEQILSYAFRKSKEIIQKINKVIFNPNRNIFLSHFDTSRDAGDNKEFYEFVFDELENLNEVQHYIKLSDVMDACIKFYKQDDQKAYAIADFKKRIATESKEIYLAIKEENIFRCIDIPKKQEFNAATVYDDAMVENMPFGEEYILKGKSR